MLPDGRHRISGLTGTYGVNQVRVRVMAINGNLASDWLYNNAPFTGTVVTNPSNAIPLANAGVDNNITLPATSVQLAGSGSDSDGTIVGYAWSQKSGPVQVAFSSKTVASPVVSGFSTVGEYVFSLSVTDNSGGVSVADEVKITVAASNNLMPVANAGGDNVITLPTSAIVLNGSGADADGSIAGYAWNQTAGPLQASFSSKSFASPTVSGLTTAGVYRFQLVVTDNAGGVSPADEVEITVKAAPVVEVVTDFTFYSRANNSGNTDAVWKNQVPNSPLAALYGHPGQEAALVAGINGRKAYNMAGSKYFEAPAFSQSNAWTIIAAVDTSDAAYWRGFLSLGNFGLFLGNGYALLYDGGYRGNGAAAQGVFVIAVRNNGDGTAQVWVNNNNIYNGALAQVALGGGLIGGDGGNYPFNGMLYNFAVAPSALSDARITQISNTWQSEIGLGAAVAPYAKAQWIADGNSLVRGYLTSDENTKNYPVQAYSELDHDTYDTPIVIAVSGQSVADMLSRQTQFLFNQINTASYAQLVVTIGGGANDLMQGETVANIKARKIQYIQNIRAWQAAHNNFPVKIILESITKNGKQYGALGSPAGLAQYETERKQLNEEAITGYNTVYGADYYANYDSDARLLDVTNQTYYTADMQHFTDVGQQVRAEVVLPYLVAAQAGEPLAPKPNA
jgi:lysophospholipase L1-like esterase